MRHFSTRVHVYGIFIATMALLTGCAGLPPAKVGWNLSDWVVEQMPGGNVRVEGDTLVIEDAEGASVWLKQKLRSPVQIEYDVTVVARGGPHDRVSDVNCFWMASDPKAPDGCPFGAGRGRSGTFTEYDSLQTYYVGMGGNTNTTTRFRRYEGSGAKPLRPEYDLRTPDVLLEGNHTYHLKIVARAGAAEFWRDGRRLFSFTDPAPLREGWFAFRTVKSHLEIRNFRITGIR